MTAFLPRQLQKPGGRGGGNHRAGRMCRRRLTNDARWGVSEEAGLLASPIACSSVAGAERAGGLQGGLAGEGLGICWS